MFESAISRFPRMRAWMFSSVTSRTVPANASWSVSSIARIAGSIGSVRVSMPRFRASASESSMLPQLEYGDGISTPRTRAGPMASAATAAVSAESTPPESPSTALVKPHLRT